MSRKRKARVGGKPATPSKRSISEVDDDSENKELSEMEIDGNDSDLDLQELPEPPESPASRNQSDGNGPEYNSQMKAVEFFGQKYFYNGKEFGAEMYREERANTFQDKSVEAVLQEIPSSNDITKHLRGLGMEAECIKPYWELATADPEIQLNRKLLLTGITAHECKELTKWFVKLPNYNRRDAEANGVDESRNHNIHIVLGPSGSGKSTLALKKLGDRSTAKHFFTVYILKKTKVDSTKDLIEYLQSSIQSGMETVLGKSYKHEKPFKMEMILIIDEANNCRDAIGSLEELAQVKGAMTIFAEQVKLVIAGTGYESVASGLDSMIDVYKYYMKPWSADDVVEVARKREDTSAEELSGLAKEVRLSLQKYPVLASLATNARAASIMIGNVPRCYYQSIVKHKDTHFVFSILAFVAATYVDNNGLRNKSAKERKTIAQAVLTELKKSRKNMYLKITTAPSFSSLEGLESTAWSLIDQNYEIGSDGLTVLNKELPTITVSPSIAWVLFHILGASPELYVGWAGMESALALFLLRQAVMIEDNPDKLERYGVVNFPLPVYVSTTDRTFSIPKLRREMVWVNGPRAPFGDVITDHTIGQAKHTLTGGSAELDLGKEMVKMGFMKEELLKGEDKADARLQKAILLALMHTWNELDSEAGEQSAETPFHHAKRPRTNRTSQGMMYPEEVFAGQQISCLEDIPCCVSADHATVTVGDHNSIGLDSDIGSWKVVFATNGASFDVKLDDGAKPVKVLPNDVDENGEVLSSRAGSDAEAVHGWIQRNVVANARVRFVFAASGMGSSAQEH